MFYIFAGHIYPLRGKLKLFLPNFKLRGNLLKHILFYRGLDMQPQRLQTALALYSNDLCGLVLLTDGLISSFSGTTKGEETNALYSVITMLYNF